MGVARLEEGGRPNRRNRLAPRVSISGLEPRASMIALRSRQASSRLKSHTSGQPTQDAPLQTPHRTAAAERFHLHGVRGRHFEWAASLWVQRALQELVAVAVCAVVTPPPSTFKQ